MIAFLTITILPGRAVSFLKRARRLNSTCCNYRFMQIACKMYEHIFLNLSSKLRTTMKKLLFLLDFYLSNVSNYDPSVFLKLISTDTRRLRAFDHHNFREFHGRISRASNQPSAGGAKGFALEKKTRRPICIVSLRSLGEVLWRPWWLSREPKAESIVNVHVTKQTPPTDYESPTPPPS